MRPVVVNRVHHCNAMSVLGAMAPDSVDLVYIDPPFGTGITQNSHGMSYEDARANYMDFLCPHLSSARRVLKPTGTLYLHLDWRHVHHARVFCDELFEEQNFLNEVIWAYDYGGRGKDRFPRKHDNILVYAKDVEQHIFNWDDVDRIPYMAPGLQKDPERAAKGKVPTDVWWMSIVGTAAKERTGYPTQKPVKLIERAILASSPPGGLVVDVFAGSGTTGQAALNTGRQFVLADVNPEAIAVMKERFKDAEVTWVE